MYGVDVTQPHQGNTVSPEPATKPAKRVIDDDEYAAAAARFVRALGRRAGTNLATLGALAGLSGLLDELLVQAVHDLRAEPVRASWAEIGEALGIKRQSAQQRFGGTGARKTGGQPGALR